MNPILPLRVLIPLLLLLSAIVASLGGFFYISAQSELEVEKESIKDVRKVINLLQSSANIMLRRNDFDGIRIQLTSFATEKQTNFAMIVDENGTVLIAAHKKYQGKRVADVAHFLNLNTGNVSLSQDRFKVRAVYPLHLPDANDHLRSKRIGLLVFEKNIRYEKSLAQANIKKDMFIFLMVILGMSTILGLFFHLMITHRVARLVDVTGKLSNGDLSVRVGLQGNDEFAQIGDALDVMAATLRAKEYELAASEERLRKSQKLQIWEAGTGT